MLHESAFKGFRIAGINPNKLHLPTGNQSAPDNEFYLMLESIDAKNGSFNDASKDVQTLWGHSFSVALEFRRKSGSSIPQLKYIPAKPKRIRKGDCGEIRVSNADLTCIQNHAFDIKRLVNEANKETLLLIKERDRTRSIINLINNESFSDPGTVDKEK